MNKTLKELQNSGYIPLSNMINKRNHNHWDLYLFSRIMHYNSYYGYGLMYNTPEEKRNWINGIDTLYVLSHSMRKSDDYINVLKRSKKIVGNTLSKMSCSEFRFTQ